MIMSVSHHERSFFLSIRDVSQFLIFWYLLIVSGRSWRSCAGSYAAIVGESLPVPRPWWIPTAVPMYRKEYGRGKERNDQRYHEIVNNYFHLGIVAVMCQNDAAVDPSVVAGEIANFVAELAGKIFAIDLRRIAAAIDFHQQNRFVICYQNITGIEIAGIVGLKRIAHVDGGALDKSLVQPSRPELLVQFFSPIRSSRLVMVQRTGSLAKSAWIVV